jgi:hypothetical protein
MTSDSARAAAVALLTRRLHHRFSTVQISIVEQIVTEIYASYDGCRVREFIPLLVERESRDRLRALPCPEVKADANVEGRVGGTVSTPTHGRASVDATH